MTPAAQQQVLEALRAAESALASCYDVDGYPGNGKTEQDDALRTVRAALAAAQPVEAEPAKLGPPSTQMPLHSWTNDVPVVEVSPQPAKAVALSDAFVTDMPEWWPSYEHDTCIWALVRAIERAVWAANKLEAP